MVGQKVEECGSSPRVRGTGSIGVCLCGPPRFIPACAGNRTKSFIDDSLIPVHPRVCGEQHEQGRIKLLGDGSSPRVRGTVETGLGLGFSDRFIPACAGNRQTDSATRCRSAVHPRVCGEQYGRVRITVIAIGSSPRVRGTGWLTRAFFRLNRFIPACAGNSDRRSAGVIAGSVHPRVCGEQCNELVC